MRLLVVAESPPTTDSVGGNGSTMITAEVLPRLPQDVELHLAWFTDRPNEPDPAVLARARTVTRLPVRSGRSALLAQPFTRLPRATWQRAGARGEVHRLAAAADVTYLHGLHTLGVLPGLPGPVVVNEIDPWSEYWSERAAGRWGPVSVYDRVQARRARRLEALAAARAATVIVVNAADAVRLAARTGGNVVAVPNGIRRVCQDSAAPVTPDERTIVLVGTLDYPPNVEAATRLVRDVVPLVRAQVPDLRVVLAGRRPPPEVLALAGDGVEVHADVPDVVGVFRSAAVAVYPGRTGRGTKNTVAEAVRAGCPVVASVESARGHTVGDHLRVGTTDEELAAAVAGLLTDRGAAAGARRAAAAVAESLPDWDDAAQRYADLLRSARDAQR